MGEKIAELIGRASNRFERGGSDGESARDNVQDGIAKLEKQCASGSLQPAVMCWQYCSTLEIL